MEKESITIKDSLTVEIQKGKDFVIISLKGFIDSYNSTNFRDLVEEMIEGGTIKILFNCQELSYVSSSGIGTFTAFLMKINQKKGMIVIVSLKQKVFDIFRLLNLDKTFIIAPNIETGLRYFDSTRDQFDINNPPVFPKEFQCPGCRRDLKVFNAGRFRCSKCKTIIEIDKAGVVSS